MDTDERRDEMIRAAESAQGFPALRNVVESLLADGVSEESLLEDLSQIRGLVAPGIESEVLDVMDLLTGWCAPSARLRRPGQPD
jgi:hypothetical protein